MTTLVEVAVALLGAAGLGTGAGAAGLVHRLRRTNRVLPRQPATAPLAWRWSPGGPARLHRRLLRAATAISSATGAGRRCRWGRRRDDPSVLAAAGQDLLERAAAADTHLATLRGRGWRPRELRAVADDVAVIEAGAHRLVGLARAWSSPEEIRPAGSATAEELLDAYEAAVRELRS